MKDCIFIQDMQSPPKPLKGHGAISNPEGRFESRRVRAVDDGWSADREQEPPPLETTVTAEHARSIITRNDSPDILFAQSINPYRGCGHACVYCYARPAHSYINLSPGLDFETKLFYKHNAAELLQQELTRPNYVCKSITLGANTDPYQPVERNLKVTRSILEVLKRFRHPVSIVTKGHLVERDIDILGDMARDNLASVLVSVTTLDPDLKRKLEPRAPGPGARLHAIRSLRDAGVPVGTLVAPIIPAINDHEIEHILEAVAEAGARSAGYVMLRLPYEVKNLFREWLAAHYPLRAAHVMSLINDLRGGRDNDPNFGSRMRGKGPFAELVRRRFEITCKRLNLNASRYPPLNTQLFSPPCPERKQLDLGF
jgi:DNA repair photolyase